MTKESEKFIQDMRVYLITKGVDEKEIDSFLMEAEDHLVEAEKDGKTANDIFGKSPKAYAKELIDSMDRSPQDNRKLIARLIAGVFGIFLVSQFIDGNTSFSLIEIIGYPISTIAWLVALIGALRMSAFHTGVKSFLIVYGIVMVPMIFTVGVTILHIEFGRDVLFLSQPVALTVGGIIIIGLIANFNSLIGLLSSLVLMLILFGAQLLFSLLHLESFAWEIGAYVISVVGLIVMMSFRKQLPKTIIKG
ncbi:HAAS domain-containing protein [Guptibacillus hwajinpoensis]|uniref:HAAS domain-containing protein n=1 Tax=Guptibacillus hwajinpoensis TaxID=208199 RepID=UPI001CFF212F|nr:hypothetical protein [Pseudalkalibacillus hwajinpoensis]WLR59283.1 hypothetical protein LC071_19425 [Pseudalkalibacillus hwajinpoensis]